MTIRQCLLPAGLCLLSMAGEHSTHQLLRTLHLTVDTFALSSLLLQLFSLIPLPLPSPPSLKLSPFLHPLQYPVLSPFLCLDQFSFLYPFPFSQPLGAHLPLATSIRLSCVSLFFCAALLLLPVLAKWQKEAVGGRAS